MAGYSHTAEEKLQVARYLVERLIYAPESVDNFDLNSEGGIEVSYPTYQSLFEPTVPTNCVGFGWTSSEKQEAFEYFIRSIPRLAQEDSFPRLRGYGEQALSFCSAHNVTNAMELAMSVMATPENPCFDSALTLFEKRLVPSDAATLFVERCVTNAAISRLDGDYLASGYVAELNRRRSSLNAEVLTNGVAMAMRLPLRCQTSRQIDLLLLEMYPLYGLSSNRLDLCCRTLRYLHEQSPFGSEKVRQYFESATNQLMNAAQPLAVVEALRGL